MVEKVVLIGAGSAMFTRGLVADLIRRGWEGELALVDTDPAALGVAEKLTRKMLALGGSPLRLQAAIGVGGRRAWEKDVLIPRQYDIFQPVGDSVMPGGTSRALRMIPAMVAIARDVVELCPAALFFNYGNPMPPVCRAVRKATGAPLVGLCHGVFHVGNMLAGILGVSPEELRYTAVGLNHLTWFTELRAAGTDLMPRLREIARQRLADPASEHPFTWELTDLFGAFPAVLDRHITEFFPHLFRGRNSYYGKTLGVDAFRFEGTIAHGDRVFAEMREAALAGGPLPDSYLAGIGGEHEQVTEIIECIRQDTGHVFSANLPNQGQIPNLPTEAVVECPCIADGAGLRPILQPPLSAGIAGTLATRCQWVETTVDAALNQDRNQFVQALLLDGAVGSVAVARRLADDLLAAHRDHLGWA